MSNEWLRQSVDILRYLPYFLQKDARFKSVNAADSREHEQQCAAIANLLLQGFVNTATDTGLQAWESFLDIQNNSSNLSTRRKKIIDTLNNSQTTTMEFMTRLFNSFLADQQGTVLEYPEKYVIEMLYHGGQVLDYSKLHNAIRTWIPAHLAYKLITYTAGNMPIASSGIIHASTCTTAKLSNDATFDVAPKSLYSGGIVTNQCSDIKIMEAQNG